MIEKKIVVPEGMRAAAYIAACNEDPGMIHISTMEIALDAACRWLSENPIVPSWKQVEDACRSGCNESRRVMIEWQRMMFLSTETHRQPSDVILKLRQIRYDLSERPESTSLNLIVDSIEEILRELGHKPPEPEIPEEIKDLMPGPLEDESVRDLYGFRILESFRRGQKAGPR